VWNAIAQQVMMTLVDAQPGPEFTTSMDKWSGYEFERRRVLGRFRDGVRNPVVITGDIHSNWANELVPDFDAPDAPPVGVEFVGTSITSGGDGDAGGAHGKYSQALLATENPGVKFHNNERGYVRCEITPTQWRTDFRTVSYVTKPGAPLNTRASFLVESGRPRLHRI
jgi:alkaline phosphatase D